MTVLVGIPDADQRANVTALLREDGYRVVEASTTQEMTVRLDELARGGFDAIVCAGLLAEQDDPVLSARLSSPSIGRALILLPADGFLSTALRAQRLRASAVLPDAAGLRRLRELLFGNRADSEGAPLSHAPKQQ